MAIETRMYKALSVAKLALSGHAVNEFDREEALVEISRELRRLDFEAKERDPGRNHAALTDYFDQRGVNE